MRSRRPRLPRIVGAIPLAIVLVAALAGPVAAGGAEWGTKNCGSFIGYVHFRYNDTSLSFGPGDATGTFFNDNDNLWHTRENNGSYSGDWYADGDPNFDPVNTWAACRNFG